MVVVRVCSSDGLGVHYIKGTNQNGIEFIQKKKVLEKREIMLFQRNKDYNLDFLFLISVFMEPNSSPYHLVW